MRTCWLVAIGIALVGTSAGSAQPVPAPVAPQLPEIPQVPDRLPPLLPAPQPPGPPPAEVPRPPTAPVIEYDPGYQYLPEQLPERSRRHALEDVCGPPGRWWVDAAADLSWASTRPAPDTVRLRIPDPTTPGATLPGPRLPIGGLDAGQFAPAFSLSFGRWFGDSTTHGVDASFFIRDMNTTFGGYAPDMLVSFPGGTGSSAPQVTAAPAGTVDHFPATLGTFFVTADVNYRNKLFCSDYARLDGVVGYRYAYLGDELYLGDMPSGSSQAFRLNRAAVSNAFNGGQIGLAGEARAGKWYASGSAKIALGVMSTDVTDTGMFAGAQGRTQDGYRRLNSLVPTSWNEFSAMPTVNLQVGRQVTKHARVFVGYSLYYLSRTGRLGDVLNPANTGLPLTDFWVQTISLGAEVRF